MAFLLVWFVNGSQVCAMSTGYTSETLPKDKQEELAVLYDVRLLTDEPKKEAIECFDVNERGFIAIGFSKASQSGSRTIAIYSDKGVFQYGYQFEAMGAFYVEWVSDNLVIHIMRGEKAITVNSIGEVEEIRTVLDTPESGRFQRKVLQATQKRINNGTYYMKNDMGILNLFAWNYSQLWHATADNNEVLLYDVNEDQFLKYIVGGIGICIFAGMLFLVVGREFVKLRKKEK